MTGIGSAPKRFGAMTGQFRAEANLSASNLLFGRTMPCASGRSSRALGHFLLGGAVLVVDEFAATVETFGMVIYASMELMVWIEPLVSPVCSESILQHAISVFFSVALARCQTNCSGSTWYLP